METEASGGLPWLDELAQALNEADRLCGRLAMLGRDSDAAKALRTRIRPVSAELEALRLRATLGLIHFG